MNWFWYHERIIEGILTKCDGYWIPISKYDDSNVRSWINKQAFTINNINKSYKEIN